MTGKMLYAVVALVAAAGVSTGIAEANGQPSAARAPVALVSKAAIGTAVTGGGTTMPRAATLRGTATRSATLGGMATRGKPRGPKGTGGMGTAWAAGGRVRGGQVKLPAAPLSPAKRARIAELVRTHGGASAPAGAPATASAPATAKTRAAAAAAATGIVDPGQDDRLSTVQGGWWTYTGVTASQVNSLLQANGARPTNIRVDDPATPTFTVTMVADSGAYASSSWAWAYGASSADVMNLATQYKARPVSIQAYQSGTSQVYAVALAGNTGTSAQSWYWYYGTPGYLNQQASANKAHFTRLWKYGTDSGGNPLFVAIMAPNTGVTAVSSWGWWYGLSAYWVQQYEQHSGDLLLDIQANGDGTFNIVLVSAPSAWVGWWYGSNLTNLARMSVDDDLRIVADQRFTDSSGNTEWLILAVENNPDPVSLRNDVLSRSLAAFGSVDGATQATLQFQDASEGTIGKTLGSQTGLNDSVRIASLSKAFVATAVLQLVADGKLNLSDSVDKWLPGVVPNGSAITVEELLNHSSGIYNYTESPDWNWNAQNMQQARTPAQLVAIATAQPPYFAPGAGYHYSNTNYVLAAMVIEKITGSYYGNYIVSHIISPLGLSHTSVPSDTSIPSPAMQGLWNDGSAVVDTTGQNASAWYGPGAMVSDVADVNTFYQALLGGKLLPAAELSDMENDLVAVGDGSSYGLGIAKVTLSCGVTVYDHSGYVPGYSTITMHSADGSRNLTFAYNAPVDHDPVLDYYLEWAAFCRI